MASQHCIGGGGRGAGGGRNKPVKKRNLEVRLSFLMKMDSFKAG